MMGSHFDDYPLLHTVLQCLRGHGREVSLHINWLASRTGATA